MNQILAIAKPNNQLYYLKSLYKNCMFLSVIIPAYNEADRLPKTLYKIFNYLEKQKYSFEIIVVDDGSTDQTPKAILDEFGEKVKVLVQKHNSGKGSAVRMGVLNSVGEQVLYLDADGSTPISEIEKLQKEIYNHDLAIGSRKDSSLIEVRQPFYREYLGKTFNFIVCSLTQIKIKDTQCGFKLIKGQIARKLFSQMKIDGFAFDVELIYLAIQKGLKIAEIPVVWINDERSKVSILRDPLIMLTEIFKIKFIHP